MTMPKFTSYMISQQPDQTAYLLNKLAEGRGGGGDGTLYDTTGQNTDGAMTQKATTNAIATKANAIAVGQALAGKVDKETGKGLSSNDFTNEELEKLNGIQAGAEVNVQSDWDQTDTSADDYIKNKPTIPAGAVLYPSTGQNTDGAMTQKASSDLFNNAVYVGTGSAGTLTPWVDTSDIVNEAVTKAKLAGSAATGNKLEIWHGNNVDMNNLTTSGIHRFYTPISNGPSGSYQYCTMLVLNYGEDFRCSQYFTGLQDDGTGIVAVRFSYHNNGNRAWSSWKTLAQWP